MCSLNWKLIDLSINLLPKIVVMEKAILGLDIGAPASKGGVIDQGHLHDIRSISTPAQESRKLYLRTIAEFYWVLIRYDNLGNWYWNSWTSSM